MSSIERDGEMLIQFCSATVQQEVEQLVAVCRAKETHPKKVLQTVTSTATSAAISTQKFIGKAMSMLSDAMWAAVVSFVLCLHRQKTLGRVAVVDVHMPLWAAVVMALLALVGCVVSINALFFSACKCEKLDETASGLMDAAPLWLSIPVRALVSFVHVFI